ncbi:MAG: hypothetical protein ABIG20_00195 [archaeon]
MYKLSFPMAAAILLLLIAFSAFGTYYGVDTTARVGNAAVSGYVSVYVPESPANENLKTPEDTNTEEDDNG